jgi:catechol 2,3-dioxygenase-like lactoylglutathione lyase family enzyme
MINGLHALSHGPDADKARAFFRDVLGFRPVAAGHGWLIFAMPHAELAVHPTEDGEAARHELYLMCDDLNTTMEELKAKGVICGEVIQARWGSITKIDVPGAGNIGLYQPKHPTAIDL